MVARPEVSILTLAVRGWLWLPVLLALVAVVAFLGARQMAIDERLLASEGVEVTGEVTRREQRRHTDSDGNVTIRYHVHYTFTTLDGRRLTASQRVSRQMYDRARPTVPIVVRYAPSRPSLNRVEQQHTLLTRLLAYLIVAILLPGSAFLMWYFSGEFIGKWRAMRRGDHGRAQVIAWREEKGKPRKGRKAPRQIMQWRDDARNRQGETWPRDPALAEAFPAGSQVIIWYDPQSERAYWEWEIMPWSPLAMRRWQARHA